MDISFSSTGAYHESRLLRMSPQFILRKPLFSYDKYAQPGSEANIFIPDFLTVKVLDADSHRLLSIVEIKRDEEAESQAIEQVINYLKQAMQYPSRDPKLCAYLVMGRRVRRFRMVWKLPRGRWSVIQ